jgi:hypothetical protein
VKAPGKYAHPLFHPERTLRPQGGVIEIAVDNTPSAGADTVEILVDGARIEGDLVALPVNGETRQGTVRLRSLVDPMMTDVGEPPADPRKGRRSGQR